MTEKFIGADPGIEVGGTRHRRMTPFELLPCPFCGGEAESATSFGGRAIIRCKNTGHTCTPGVAVNSIHSAAEAANSWNTRHLAAAKVQAVDVEAIEQAISWMRRTYPVEMKLWADKLTAALARQ
jgi:transcription elongation factor Elf1